MTCRFELEFEGKSYPRSCPTCGISGKCHKEYEQVKLTPAQAERLGFHYIIVDPKGKPEPDKAAKWNNLGSGIPSQVLIAIGNKHTKVSQETLDGVAEAEARQSAEVWVHPGKPGHETYVPGYTPPKYRPREPYGPVNCNVARTRNGEKRPLTCERCGKLNVSDCSSSELAEGCLFYTHEVGFGFRAIVGAEHEPKPHPFMAPSKFDPDIHRADVGTKLSRVQRAKIMDLIEDALKDRPVLIDIAVDEYTKRLIAILDET